MHLTVDREAGALYLKLTDKPIVHTREISDYCIIDYDANGKIVGVELLADG